MVSGFASHLEKFSSVIMRAGRSLPDFDELRSIFPDSKQIQDFVSEYFIVVVHLCRDFITFTKKTIFGQLWYSLDDSQFITHQSDLEKWSLALKEKANHLTMKVVKHESNEQSAYRIRGLSFMKEESKRQKAKWRSRLLGRFCQYEYNRTVWSQTRKLGTSTFQDQEECSDYKTWKSQPDSNTLVFVGKLGSGKSVLLANIVDDLFLNLPRETRTAYFFCRHDVAESLKTQTIIGSLAKQILETYDDLILKDKTKSFKEDDTVLEVNQIMETLTAIVAPEHQVFLVLDGLNECPEDIRYEVLSLLHKIQQTCSKVKLCLSVRLEPDTHTFLERKELANAKAIRMSENNPDIISFINATLEEHLEQERLVVGDPTLILEIQKALKLGSQGMFLWVSLKIHSLTLIKTDDGIRKSFPDVPETLSELFVRILEQAEIYGIEYRVKLFELITVAMRPLTLDELQEALSVIPGDTKWDPSKHINDVRSVLNSCGGLITIDEEELTVRVSHNSISQWLLAGHLTDTSGYSFDLERAQSSMADIIITYLNYGVFDKTVVRIGNAHELGPKLKIKPAHIVGMAFGSSSKTRKIALTLLKSSNTPDLDISRALKEVTTNNAPQTDEHYRFLHYAEAFWIFHILHFDNSPAMTPFLRKLFSQEKLKVAAEGFRHNGEFLLLHAMRAKSKTLFEILVDLDMNTDIHTAAGRSVLSFAAAEGRFETIKLLWLKKNIRPNYDHSMRTPLSYAAEAGHSDIVAFLNDGGKAGSLLDFSCQSSLHYAAQNNHIDVVRLLAPAWEDLSLNMYSLPYQYFTPVRSAIIHGGHFEVIRVLLGVDNIRNCEQRYSRVSFEAAIKSGQHNILELLISHGIVPTLKDWKKMSPSYFISAVRFGTVDILRVLLAYFPGHFYDGVYAADEPHPLTLAARLGRDDVMKLLLSVDGIDVNKVDNFGETALYSAIRFGCVSVVQTLLEHPQIRPIVSIGPYMVLEKAVLGSQREIIKVFLDDHRILTHERRRGHRSLQLAIEEQLFDSLEAILATGKLDLEIEVGSAEREQFPSALHCAVSRRSHGIVELLLRYGADVNCQDDDGMTPLIRAVYLGDIHTVKVLLKSPKIDIFIMDYTTRSAEVIALREGLVDIKDLLLREIHARGQAAAL